MPSGSGFYRWGDVCKKLFTLLIPWRPHGNHFLVPHAIPCLILPLALSFPDSNKYIKWNFLILPRVYAASILSHSHSVKESEF